MLFTKGPFAVLSKAFKGIANLFKTARLLIALKVIAVIAAFQFVAERIDMIGDIFRKIWGKITGFFKGIVEWFKNSPVGKFFGLSGDDGDERPKREMKNMDENTYDIGVDTNLGDDTVMVGDEDRRTSKDPSFVVDPVTNKIIQPGEEGYEEARANRLQDTQDYETDAQNILLQGTGKTVEDLRSVNGDTVNDGEEKKFTSKSLADMNAEMLALSKSSAPITIQNNNAISNNNTAGSNASIGFQIHEPDSSFVNVRKDNTVQTL